jgi:ubiquinone/menaquinone biosynthesis C-methylase UbiE
MSTPEQSPLPGNSYILNPESASEMARLMLQDRLINEMIGGLLPEREDLEGINSILDIGCGPGGWALDVARSYPKKEITGIDISDMMLTYANEQKKIHKLENIHFKKMDVRQKLAFADRSFDLVNIRAAVGYMPRQIWPLLLKECMRITNPGGILRLSESDRLGLTNSPSYEKYARYCAHLLSKLEYGFSADTYTFGMSPMHGKLLQDAGYTNIQMRSYALDFSYGTPFYPIQLQNTEISFRLLQQRLIQMGIVTQEEIENLCEAVLQELRRETFCGVGYLFTFWGITTRV